MYGRSRRRIEERVAEIRHRLAMEEACGGTVIGGVANLPGFLELEEELLDEAAELERILAPGSPGPPHFEARVRMAKRPREVDEWL